jgi:uncharacterized protein YjbJ (UPF0337 family)
MSALREEANMNDPKNTVGEEARAIGERISGTAKDVAGSATGNRSLEREGEREKAEGRARQAANEVWSPDTADRYQSGYVTGLYRTPEEAARAYDNLTTKHGYRQDDVDVLMSDETRQRYYPEATPGQELTGKTKAAEGLGVGSAIGGGLGAAFAAIFAVGSNVVIPGLGLVVAGPIAAALAGAGAGGATGGLIGALVGAGMTEERAREYDQGVRDGGIVLGAKARDEKHAMELERDYTTYGGTSVRR